MGVVGDTGAYETVQDVDAVAFRALYDRTLPLVYGYFVHRGGGAAAEDLTQETYVAAALALRNHTDVSPAWLLTVARNKLVDHLRRAEREERRLLRSWRLERRDHETDGLPHDASVAIAALSALPAAQRAAMILHHIDGRTVGEVAGLLGRSEHAVESLLARGRRTFRRHYAEEPDD